MNDLVLLLEDDAPTLRLLRYFLDKEGFSVEGASTIAQARFELGRWVPAALVVDCGLPDGDGLDFCRELTSGPEGFQKLPILIMSGDDQRVTRYKGYSCGACDFVAKPFDPLELALRLRAHIALGRQAAVARDDVLRVGPIELDSRNHTLCLDERSLALTPNECSILKMLMGAPGRAFDVESLLVDALGYPPSLGNPEIVRTHVRNLRLKLETDPHAPRVIVTIPRVGYSLKA